MEASKGAVPSRSTKIVVDAAAPTHCFTTSTVENSCLFVIVQVSVTFGSAGAVTANGPPAYGCGAPVPQ